MFENEKTKSTDPHDNEISRLIEDEWGDFEQVVHNRVGHLEENYLRWRRRSATAKIAIIAGIITIIGGENLATSGFIDEIKSFPAFLSMTIYIAGWLAIGVAIWVLWRWSKVKREFNKVFNPIVFDKAFQIVGLEGQHLTYESKPKEEIVDLLKESELITEGHNRYQIDDMVDSEYQGRPFFLAELDVKYVTGSGKNRTTKNVFHGVLVKHQLPKTLTGKTFVTTEGDKLGFGKISWWGSWFKADETPQETVLEWNDFENTLHVATTDGTEARYILTPDFMANLYDWWVVRKGKIRLSFIADRFYILYPDKRVKIGSSTVSLAEKDLKKYVLAVVRPLWHMKKLMESTESRLRVWQ